MLEGNCGITFVSASAPAAAAAAPAQDIIAASFRRRRRLSAQKRRTKGRMAAASGERDRAPRQTRLESERSLWRRRRRFFTTRVDLFRVCGGRPPHGEHSRVLEEGHASRPIFHVHFLFLTAVMGVGKSSWAMIILKNLFDPLWLSPPTARLHHVFPSSLWFMEVLRLDGRRSWSLARSLT